MDAAASSVHSKAASSDAAAQLKHAREISQTGNRPLAIEWLRRAAAAGHLEAKSELARHLIAYPPKKTEEGVRVAHEAADEGDGAAAHLLAMVAAEGRHGKQDWQAALDHVVRAAALGLPLARAELAALAGKWDVAQSLLAGSAHDEDWPALRKSADLSRFLAPARYRIAPLPARIAVVENFTTPDICRWLVARYGPMLKPALIVSPDTGTPVPYKTRSNTAAEIDIGRLDLVLALVRARIAAVAEVPVSGLEEPAVLHYRVGQEFQPHYDYLNTERPGYAEEVATEGQRVLTFLVYLNEGFGGAETEFPILNWRYKGRTGDGMFFWNVTPEGQPDRLTLHAGTSPTHGEKWLLSQWVRFTPR